MTHRKIRRCKICGKEIGNKPGRWKYCFEHRSRLHQKTIYLGIQVEKGWVVNFIAICNIVTGTITFFNNIKVRKGLSYRAIPLFKKKIDNTKN